MKRFPWPLGLFLALACVLALGLRRDPGEIPSPLIDQPAPAFELARLDDPGQRFAPHAMAGQVWVLNVWASWCASCRQEHPVLLALARQRRVPIVGLNYKDRREAGLQWLARFGNPYVLSAFDEKGRVGIDYGVYGVPETFVIDRQGRVRLKLTGPLTEESVRARLLPLVEELERG